MHKQTRKVFGGMIKDIAKTQSPESSYFDATYGRTTATKSSSDFSFTNEKGNEIDLVFPTIITVEGQGIVSYDDVILDTKLNLNNGIYTDFYICGSVTTTKGLVLFTAGKNDGEEVIGAIWLYEDYKTLKLLQINSFEFYEYHYITAISNYETEKIEKIYWVDGVHQLRFLNIHHSVENGDREESYQIPLEMMDAIAPYNISPIKITGHTTGGIHKAGMIQYTYTLYKVNGSESKSSALTDLLPLTKTDGGGKVDEDVSTTPIIEIKNIDSSFDNIKIYAIKYTSLDQPPTVSVINDLKIPESKELTIYDTGKILYNITIEELLLKSNSIYVPSDIETKENRLFIANYTEKPFKFKADMRAFSFNKFGTCNIYHNVKDFNNYEKVLTFDKNQLPLNNDDSFDSVNLDYDEYCYNTDVIPRRGATGRFCEYELTSIRENNGRQKFFKDEEIYRLGIVFYNHYGTTCEPLWISDFKAPEGNLEGFYNTLNFKLTSEFKNTINLINNDYDKPVGFKLLLANRTTSDSSIIASGLVTSMFINYTGPNNSKFEVASTRAKISVRESKRPNPWVRGSLFQNNEENISCKPIRGYMNYALMNFIDRSSSKENRPYKIPEMQSNGQFYGAVSWQYNSMMQLYSPETVFNKSGIPIPTGCYFRHKALIKNNYNSFWAKELNVGSGKTDDEAKGYEGVHPMYAARVDSSGSTGTLSDGMIDHAGGSDVNRYSRTLWNRQFGNNPVITDGSDQFIDYYNGEAVIPIKKYVLEENDYSFGISQEDNNTSVTNIDGGTVYLNTLVRNSDKVKKVKFKFKDITFTTKRGSSNTYTFKVYLEYGNLNKHVVYEKTELIPAYGYISIPDIDLVPLDIMVLGVNTPSKIFATISSADSSETIEGDLNINHDVCYEDDATVLATQTFMVDRQDFSIRNIVAPTAQNQYVPVRNKTYTIFGEAEYSRRGQGYTNYAGLPEFRYTNTLVGTKTDGQGKKYDDLGEFGRRIVSINSDNNGCITFIINKDNSNTPNPYSYDDLVYNTFTDMSIFGEIVRSKQDIYFGGLYGGNRFEDKLRTEYNEIGSMNLINLNTLNTESFNYRSPGDTFVHQFKFLRMIKKDDNVSQGLCQMEEMISYPCETSMDLMNRSDKSVEEWDSIIAYTYEQYHEYNDAYSLKNGLIQHRASEYYVKDTDVYNTSIIPSKKKSAGEVTDSWLSPLVNDTLTVNGAYGPINKMVNFNDQIYTFQDKAITQLSISPRIQMSTEDGAGLELGTGSVLPRYINVTQNSGTKNKHSIVKTPYGVYYYDDINDQVCVFNGEIAPLSETGGLHSYIQNYPLEELKTADPRFGTGVVSGYDPINKDVYMTFRFDDYTDTLIYNEKKNMFISRRDDRVSSYITSNSNLFTTIDSKVLYKEGIGKFNVFYGEQKPTTITFIINEDADLDTILDVIDFKSEVYKDGKDQPGKTITHYRAYNEFQDTGLVPVVEGKRANARRYLRDWNISIGRNKGTRERIRNPWNFVELTFDNKENLELILHDLLITYTI